MPAKELSPIEVYELLPGTNCKVCGEANCMAFAVKLVNREVTLNDCPPIKEPKYNEEYTKLWNLLKPPVKAVEIGTGERKTTIGGEYVVHRHEFTYFNPTALALDVSDEMTTEELESRVRKADEYKYEYIGMTLKLDMLAVRCTSGSPPTFSNAVEKTLNLTGLPLILCSHDPAVMSAGLEVAECYRPLIYAATSENWRQMADLALKYECPIVVSSPFDINQLKSLAKNLWDYGVKDIVLDPGTAVGEGVSATLNNFTMLRWSAINLEDEELGFPLLGTPISAWTEDSIDPAIDEWNEVAIASNLMVRYADALIIHSVSNWALLPMVILRQNIYTDPRKPVSVEPGVKIFGSPDKNSPVLLTTNFALTYYTVASDIESGGLDCYLVVVDTEGISVESAVAGRKMTSENVAETLGEHKVGDLVTHRHLIIPGRAARLSGEIEEVSSWSVHVGPMDSSEIKKYLETWNPNG